MKNANVFLLLCFIAASSSAQAQAAVNSSAKDDANYIMCRNNKTVRTIRVEKDDSKECVAVYTKAGIDKEVGRGQNMFSCVKIVENIRENLDKAGWKCKDLTNVSITAISEDND